jgi:Ca2+-binding RTX toxin-like protein
MPFNTDVDSAEIDGVYYIWGTEVGDFCSWNMDWPEGPVDAPQVTYGYGGDDWILGANGNDELHGGAGADQMWGGGGIDTAFYDDSATGVTINLAAGTGTGGTAQGDLLFSIENVIGSAHNDILIGNAESNGLLGSAGDDTLFGGGGHDVLDGGDNKDTLWGQGDDDDLYGFDGDDTLQGGAGADFLSGGNGLDTAGYVDSATGVFVFLLTGDTLYGDAAGDTFSSIENLTGSGFDDDLWGDDKVNVINGLNGNDELKGYGGADTLNGGFGNDTLNGGAGADTLNGGPDSDTASYDGANNGVYVNLLNGQTGGTYALGDTFISIENLTGSKHNDDLWGNGDVNVLEGGEGKDSLKGFGGADTLNGGDGDDTLYGGLGADNLNGGFNSDTAAYMESGSGVVVKLKTGFTQGGEAEGDVLQSIENVSGSDYADTLWGEDTANTLKGEDGADNLKGFGGADILYGGNQGDYLDGMDGTDTLYGGSGKDSLNGGTGADTFVFSFLSDSTVAAFDTIMDFADGTEASGDRIDLSKIDANSLVSGDQSFLWIGNNNNFYADADPRGQLRFNGGFVEGDVNDDLVVDFRIQVNSAPIHEYGIIL